MRIGLQLRAPVVRRPNVIDAIVDTAKLTEEAGLTSLWLAQAFEFDALTALAIAGRATSTIDLGTAVVPTYPRHPLVMAQQALTVQAATGNRLSLGIGPSHRQPIEEVFGYSFDGVLDHVRSYLDALLPALAEGAERSLGELVMKRAPSPLAVAGAERCPVLLGALGPHMLDLAGGVADGTVTSTTGPRTLTEHIVPRINAAAERAGRPTAPRIVGCLPLCVTDDVEGARALAHTEYAGSERYPSYRAMLEREGVTHAAELAIIGSEDEVAEAVTALVGTGITDYCARLFGSEDDARRSIALLGELQRSSAAA